MIDRQHRINVQQFIDSHPLSTMQMLLLLQCFLAVGVDGFDTASIGFIAPAIKAEWHLQAAQLAPLFGSGLFGLMAGAFAVGPISDRHGRKPTLIGCLLFFGMASLLSAYSPNLHILVALRFLTGLGLGGAMPNAITLTSEYCPADRRSFLVTLMFCGFTLGSAFGGIVASQIVSVYGWRSVLVAGGIMPILIAPVLMISLPESVRYLVMKDRAEDRALIRRTLSRIDSERNLETAEFVGSEKPTASPVSELFRRDLLPGTLLLWIAFFMSLLVVYLLSSWLPTVLHSSGISLKAASLITATFQVGGTIGSVSIGRLMDKLTPQHVVGIAYMCAAPFVTLIGFATANRALMLLAVFGAGFCVSGSQTGGNALAAAYYPTPSRATGVSWATGVGRVGSILGSMLGGAIFTMGWPLRAVFGLIAIPTLVSGTAIYAIGRLRTSPRLPTEPFIRS